MDFLFLSVSCLLAIYYKWVMFTCGYFNSRCYLVMFRAFTCCLLGVGHPLHDQVGKDDFVFVNVSCLFATSYYGYGSTCGYSKVRCYIEYVCCVLVGYLLLVIY
jgi:hypothetical protein